MECKQNTIPQWDQGDIGIPTTWFVKITICEFASFLNFLYPRISKVTLYICVYIYIHTYIYQYLRGQIYIKYKKYTNI